MSFLRVGNETINLMLVIRTWINDNGAFCIQMANQSVPLKYHGEVGEQLRQAFDKMATPLERFLG